MRIGADTYYFVALHKKTGLGNLKGSIVQRAHESGTNEAARTLVLRGASFRIPELTASFQIKLP